MVTNNPTLLGSPLFLTPAPSLAKFANSKLSKDPGEWEQEIMDYLHEQHPYIAEHKIVVAMHKTDAEEGHGVGNVKIGEKVVLPIVVEANRLQPLDLFVADDRIQALTKAAFTAAVQSHSFGKAVKPGQGEAADSSITYATLPPFDGKYAYGSLAYTRAGFTSALERINAAGRLEMCLANPWFTEVAGQFAKHAQTDRETVKVAEAPRTGALVRIRPFTKIAASGVFEVMTDQGARVGLVCDTLLTFGRDGIVDAGPRTFIGLDKQASYSCTRRGHFGGRSASEDVTLSLPGAASRAVIGLVKQGAAVVSEAFDVLALDGSSTLIQTDDGRRWTIRQSADNGMYKEAGNQIFIDDQWAFIRVGPVVEVFDPELANQRLLPLGLSSIEKVAERYVTRQAGPIQALATLPAEGVYAETLRTKLAGLDPELVDSVMDQLDTHGAAYFRVEPTVVKVAGTIYEFPAPSDDCLASLMLAAGLFITPELCKRAKVQEEKAKKTIDAILGLNFLNDENMHKFVDKVDTLEDAKDCVAELLLASRLGLSIDSQPLRTALFSLDSVTRDLRELRNAVTAK